MAACRLAVIAAVFTFVIPLGLKASPPATTDWPPPALADSATTHSIEQFLARADEPHHYRALRRLEAETRRGGRSGWLEAWTEFTPNVGFRYEIVAEGGSDYIRSRVLRSVLESEKELIARGEAPRSAIAACNYGFRPIGVDPSGLVKLLLFPRHRDTVLGTGTVFLRPDNGDLVRVEGRLARNPSFWVKKVDIVRHYRRIEGVLLPVALESTAHVRLYGPSRLRMTYTYAAVDGHALRAVTMRGGPPDGGE